MDKFRKTSEVPPTTLSGSISDSDVIIPLSSTTGVATDTDIDIVIDRVDDAGEKTPEKMEVITVRISGNNGINAVRGRNGLAQPHDQGATVEFNISTGAMHNDMVEGIRESLNADGSLILSDVVSKAINDATVPVGSVKAYYGTKATFDVSPARHGWLFIEKGVAYSKTTYANLYAHLKAVDAASVTDDTSPSTTFKFHGKWFGRTMVSIDPSDSDFNTLGKSVGAKTHTLTEAEMPRHTHALNNTANRAVSNSPGYSYGSGVTAFFNDGGNATASNTGGNGAHNNLQPSLLIGTIIKY